MKEKIKNIPSEREIYIKYSFHVIICALIVLVIECVIVKFDSGNYIAYELINNYMAILLTMLSIISAILVIVLKNSCSLIYKSITTLISAINYLDQQGKDKAFIESQLTALLKVKTAIYRISIIDICILFIVAVLGVLMKPIVAWAGLSNYWGVSLIVLPFSSCLVYMFSLIYNLLLGSIQMTELTIINKALSMQQNKQ